MTAATVDRAALTAAGYWTRPAHGHWAWGIDGDHYGDTVTEDQAWADAWEHYSPPPADWWTAGLPDPDGGQ